MMGFLRHLFLKDIWLKLFSLALAILIRITVSFALEKENNPIPMLPPPNPEHTFRNLPVSILTSQDDPRKFRVEPRDVELTLEGNPNLLQNLESKDLRIFVNLAGVDTTNVVRRRVEVITPAGITHYRVSPLEVNIIPVPRALP